jgi:hypothetical protein
MSVPPIPPSVPVTQIGKSGVLFTLLGANMNSTADQALSKAYAFSAFVIDKIIVTNASTSITTAVGGFYGAASKGAPILVSAAQTYAALTASDIILNPTLQAVAQRRMTGSSVFFSLTTAQGVSATADIYVMGTALQ